jgi:hypothetical protein
VGKEGKIKECLIRSTKTMRTIIVDDWRLQPSWVKHIHMKGSNNIHGKEMCRVIFENPDGLIFTNRMALESFLHEKGEIYSRNIYDFRTHYRSAKRLGVVKMLLQVQAG